MTVANIYKALNAYIRLDGNGVIIPGSVQFRKHIPKQGVWKQIYLSYCCNSEPDGIIMFSNTTASANFLTITSSDNRINWSGTLTNGQIIAFPIPNGVDETFTVTTSSFSGRTLTNTTTLGSGVITSPGALASNTTTFTTTIAPGSQYLSVLS